MFISFLLTNTLYVSTLLVVYAHKLFFFYIQVFYCALTAFFIILFIYFNQRLIWFFLFGNTLFLISGVKWSIANFLLINWWSIHDLAENLIFILILWLLLFLHIYWTPITTLATWGLIPIYFSPLILYQGQTILETIIHISLTQLHPHLILSVAIYAFVVPRSYKFFVPIISPTKPTRLLGLCFFLLGIVCPWLLTSLAFATPFLHISAHMYLILILCLSHLILPRTALLPWLIPLCFFKFFNIFLTFQFLPLLHTLALGNTYCRCHVPLFLLVMVPTFNLPNLASFSFFSVENLLFLGFVPLCCAYLLT